METTKYASLTESLQKHIASIEGELALLTSMLDQEKNDFGKLGWMQEAKLNYIAAQLAEIRTVWSGEVE